MLHSGAIVISEYFLQVDLLGQVFSKMEYLMEHPGEVWRVVDFCMEMLDLKDVLRVIKMPTFIPT